MEAKNIIALLNQRIAALGMSPLDEEQQQIITGGDFDSVEALIEDLGNRCGVPCEDAEEAMLTRIYENEIGYDPFSEGCTLLEVRAVLREYFEERADDAAICQRQRDGSEGGR